MKRNWCAWVGADSDGDASIYIQELDPETGKAVRYLSFTELDKLARELNELANPLRDYGMGDSTPMVRGLPQVELDSSAPACPNCGNVRMMRISVQVENPMLRGGKGLGVYVGCPCCPFASPMIMMAGEHKQVREYFVVSRKETEGLRYYCVGCVGGHIGEFDAWQKVRVRGEWGWADKEHYPDVMVKCDHCKKQVDVKVYGKIGERMEGLEGEVVAEG